MTDPTNKPENEAGWWEHAISRRDAHKLGLGIAAVAGLAGCSDEEVKELALVSFDEALEGGEVAVERAVQPGQDDRHFLCVRPLEYRATVLSRARPPRSRSKDSFGDIAVPAAIIRRGASKIAAFRQDDGTVIERSAVCTHVGCIVHWNGLEKCWDCPCHGSQFQPDGQVINGPAIRPLAEAGIGE